MNITRINYLRNKLDNEEISLDQISEIHDAFEQLIDGGAELRDNVSNAMSSDMLDELEANRTTIERRIYEWLKANDGNTAPNFDIESLADYINNTQVILGTDDGTLRSLLGE